MQKAIFDLMTTPAYLNLIQILSLLACGIKLTVAFLNR
jgi:hypothetical protein